MLYGWPRGRRQNGARKRGTTRVLKLLKRFRDGDGGQGLVEYSLITALVSIGLVLVLVVFRNSVGTTMANTTTSLQAVPGTAYAPGVGVGGGVGGGQGNGQGGGQGNGRGGGTGGGRGSGRGGGTGGGQGSGS